MFGLAAKAARAGVNGTGIPLGCGSGGGDFLPGAEAGINRPLRAESFERCGISLGSVGLTQHRTIPVESEPAKGVNESRVRLLAVARRVRR